MLSYSQYTRTKKELPRVQFGIRLDSELLETIEVQDPRLYISTPEDTLDKQGLVMNSSHIYKHPALKNKYFTIKNNAVIAHDSIDDALKSKDDSLVKHLSNLNIADEVLAAHYHRSKYSEPERRSIEMYSNANNDINRRILSGEELSVPHKQMMRHLDIALMRRHTPDSMIIYTGTNKSHADTIRRNEQVLHPSYLSTSISPIKALMFAQDKGGDVVAIHVPAKHPGSYIADMSAIQSEKEFLLPKNTHLLFDHSKTQSIGAFGNSTLLHHAHIIPE